MLMWPSHGVVMEASAFDIHRTRRRAGADNSLTYALRSHSKKSARSGATVDETEGNDPHLGNRWAANVHTALVGQYESRLRPAYCPHRKKRTIHSSVTRDSIEYSHERRWISTGDMGDRSLARASCGLVGVPVHDARYRARRLARQSAAGERQLHEYMIVHPTVALTYSELTRLKAKGSRSGS